MKRIKKTSSKTNKKENIEIVLEAHEETEYREVKRPNSPILYLRAERLTVFALSPSRSEGTKTQTCFY